MPPTPPIITTGVSGGSPASSLTPLCVVPPLMWSQTSEPAAGSQASASRATSAGNNHVCYGICATWVVTTALAAGVTIDVYLRDGASGSGTIFWRCTLGLPGTAAVGTTASIVVGPMALMGTAGNQLTCEFSAGVASTVQAISFWGYTTN